MSGEDRSRADRITYADIFAVREFRALFISRALSTVGDYLARAALTIAVFARTGSTALMGITFALTMLPDLIGGPLLAGLADRFPRRAVMVAADGGRALLLLVMAIPGTPLAVLWALLFVVRLLDAPYLGAYHATMSVVLPGKQLVKGSAVTQLVNHLSYTVGYGLGGVIVGLSGLSWVLVGNAGTFAVSGLVILRGLLARPATASSDSPPTLLGAARATMRYLVGNPRLRLIMLFPLPIAITLVCETLAAPYAAQISDGTAVAGLLMGAGPAGIVLGLWLLPVLIPDQRPSHVLVLSIISCAPLVLFVAVPGPVLATALIVVSGAALCYWIPLAAEFTQSVPNDMRGQAVGLLTTAMKATQGVAILSFGLVAQAAASSTVIAVSGAIGTIITIGLSLAWTSVGRTAAVATTSDA